MITSIVLLCLFLLFVVIGALFGFLRGMTRSLIRLGAFLAAAVLTFFVSGLVTNVLNENIVIKGQTLGEMLLNSVMSNEAAARIFNASPLLQEAVLTLPAFGIAVVIFPVVFILLNLISWIVYCVIPKPIFKRKKLAGLGIGAVTGVLIFGMLFAPLFAVINLLPENSALNEAIDSMVEQEILEADVADIIKQELEARDHFVIKAYSLIGVSAAGRLYLSNVSKFEHGGHKTDIPSELDPVFSAAQVMVDGGLLKALLDSENPNAVFTVLADKALVSELIGKMFESQLLCSAVPEILAMAMEGLAMSVNIPADKEAVYNDMMDKISEAIKNGDIDYDAIKEFEEAYPDLVRDFDVDFAPSEDGQITEIMTEEEYEAEIQKLVDLTLTISKIINVAVADSTEAIANALANMIVKNVQADVTENGAIVADFNADTVKGAISKISADSVDSAAVTVLAQMNDPAKFTTNVATIESITNSIRETVKNAMSDSSKAQETAGVLAGAISSFAGAVENAFDENGQIDIVKLDFNKLAEGVTGLQNSALKGVGSCVLELVAAGDLGGNSMASTALGAIKESYDNGENISGAINSAGALIVIGSTIGNKDDEGSKEALNKSFADLVHNLDEVTMKLLPAIVTEDTLLSIGVDAKYTETAYYVTETLLRELMALKGASDYDNEVDAVLEVYDLVMKGVNNFVEEDIQKFIDSAMKSDAIYNTIVKLADRGDILFEIETEDQKTMIVNTLNAYYAESAKQEKDYVLFSSFSKIIGVDGDVNLQ